MGKKKKQHKKRVQKRNDRIKNKRRRAVKKLNEGIRLLEFMQTTNLEVKEKE